MTSIDWQGLMRAGLQELRLLPSQFWQLTPAELRIMLGTDKAIPALSRARLEELSAAYPDLGKVQDHDGTDGSD